MYTPNMINYSISNIIDSAGSKFNIEKNLILKKTLLQLPKFSDNELQDHENIKNEIIRIGLKIKSTREENKLPNVNHEKIEVRNLTLGTVPENIAKIIHKNYHYIASHRTKSFYKGLYSSEKKGEFPLSLITLSPFDLKHIEPYLPHEIKPNEILVVSRVYSFEDAPKNSISFMMGCVVKWIREAHPKVKMLLTYVNPNLGFFGSSLKASNWFFYGKEIGIRYAYLDEDYITLRDLSKKINISDIARSRYPLLERLKFSIQPLKPLELYAFFIDRKLREKNPLSFNHEFVKNPPIT